MCTQQTILNLWLTITLGGLCSPTKFDKGMKLANVLFPCTNVDILI